MGRIGKKRSRTLSGIFLRYVLIMLGALFALGICIIITFNVLVNIGSIYPANYVERKIDEAYDTIQSAEEVTEDMIPPLCHYVIFSMDGKILSGNMSEDSVRIARDVADHRAASGRYFYKVILRPNESVVLQYSLAPQYQSAFLREHLIAPQNLLSIIAILGGAVIILVPSIRFGDRKSVV